MKDAQPKFTDLALRLGGRFEWSAIPSTSYRYIRSFQIDVDGVALTVVPIAGKSGLSGVHFAATLVAPVTRASIVFRHEGFLDRLGSRMRINREFSSGDASFDNVVYVETDAPDATLRRVLESPHARASILQMLSAGAREVDIMDAWLALTAAQDPTAFAGVPSVSGGAFASPQLVSFRVDAKRGWNLERLFLACRALSRLPHLLHGAGSPRDPYARGNAPAPLEAPVATRWGRGVGAGLFATLCFVSWMAMTTSALSPPRTLDWDAFTVGAGIGAFTWTLTLLGLAVLFRGRSTSLRTILVFAVLMIGQIPLLIEVAQTLNASLDDGARTQVPAIGTERRGNTGGVYCVLTLATGETISAAYPVCEPGRTAKVTLGSGALGSRWVANVE